MLTIFTIPKPFQGHIEIIQRNAIHSWSLLQPACEVVLCGDDPGTDQVAAEFGAKHLPHIARNEYGTPLLDWAFDQVAQMASHRLMCYVNADIMLLSDFVAAVQRIPFRRFMMVGRRWDVGITQQWDFGPGWEERLRHYVSVHGTPFSWAGIDYFVFPRDGVIEKLPPFAVGRPAWDCWFMYRARAELRIPLVDVSRVTRAIHQNHDYSHVPNQRGEKYDGAEGDRNLELSGPLEHQFDFFDATHVMTPKALLPAYRVLIPECGFRFYLRRRLRRLPVLVPATRPLINFLRMLMHPFRGSAVSS